MSEPSRLVDATSSDTTRALLRADREHDPPHGAKDRLLVGLGLMPLPAPQPVEAPPPPAAAGLGLAKLAKWVAVAALPIVAATAGLLAVRSRLDSRPPTPVSPAGTAPAANAPPSAVPAEQRTIEPAPAPAPAPAPCSQPPSPEQPARTAPSAATVAPARVASAPAPADAGPSLAAEIAALDRARRALDAGDPVRCLALLGEYRREFPRGVLSLEAWVLRIDALARSGNSSSAAAEARRFLGAHPNSPHAARLRALAEGGPGR
jgi:hypothetical protein